MDLSQDFQDFSNDPSVLSSEQSICSESSANENNQSMLISESSIIGEDILEEFKDGEDILEEFKESKEFEVNTEYPNLVYAEFMTLITKYKINNTTGK